MRLATVTILFFISFLGACTTQEPYRQNPAFIMKNSTPYALYMEHLKTAKRNVKTETETN